MIKARIVVFDDLAILDETEIINNKDVIGKVANNLLLSTSGAESCEVYDVKSGKMIMRFTLTRKGKVQALKIKTNPNLGGARPGGGRKPSPNSFTRYIAIRVTQDVGQWLDEHTGNSMAAWIRDAINEKMEREIREESEL